MNYKDWEIFPDTTTSAKNTSWKAVKQGKPTKGFTTIKQVREEIDKIEAYEEKANTWRA